MANGVDRRAQIDIETVRALLLINGGGVIALLSLLSQIFGKAGYEELASPILWGTLIFVVGLGCAVIHSRLLRKCSLVYDQHNMIPPKGRLLGFKLSEPTVCWFSYWLMWLSICAFLFAGIFVAVSGIVMLPKFHQEPVSTKACTTANEQKPQKTTTP
jgi:hypothetical protein